MSAPSRLWQQLNERIGYQESSGRLSDFTTTARVLPLSLIAVVIGVVAAYVAMALLKLIYFFTQLFFFQRLSFQPISPAGNHLGDWTLVVPVLGGIIVGLMGRFGSERIRGHGIPEAIEVILFKHAKVEPRVAVLKPVSSAIAIGSGGPFGAEGPIIMTGGAFGSLIAQFFHLTDSERRTLLVAGSAAGMAGIFATPVAAVLLAVELLLFEWKPRSLVPVALASATSAATRRYLLGVGPLFSGPEHGAQFSAQTLLACLAMGLAAGLFAMFLSICIYAVEDAFEHLPLHRMWWPALGGITVGVGGLIFPPALGVGYENIGELLQGRATLHLIVGILLVKTTIWLFSLGSGNSGGILAPILMMGGALGAAGSFLFVREGMAFWALVTMAATLAGALGTPLTAIIFALELTHEINLLLPLLIAATMAHLVTVLLMRRSIVTEKVSRRGLHLSREYGVDPLEVVFIRDVMRTNIVALPSSATPETLAKSVNVDHVRRGQWLYPVVQGDGSLSGVVTRSELHEFIQGSRPGMGAAQTLEEIIHNKPQAVVAYPDDSLRAVAYRMAESGLSRFPVVERRSGQRAGRGSRGTDAGTPRLLGMVALTDLLKARVAYLEAERKRERVLPFRLFPLRDTAPKAG